MNSPSKDIFFILFWKSHILALATLNERWYDHGCLGERRRSNSGSVETQGRRKADCWLHVQYLQEEQDMGLFEGA